MAAATATIDQKAPKLAKKYAFWTGLWAHRGPTLVFCS